MATEASDDSAFPIEPFRLSGAPDQRMAQVTLGLTFYLGEPLVWAQEAAASALMLYLAHAPEREHWWFTTSRRTEWSRVKSSTGLQPLIESLSSTSLHRPRHLFDFRLVDDTTCPGAGFRYQEVDPSRGLRTPILQMWWPQEQDPMALVRVSQAIAQQWPIWSGIGGHLATWNPHEKAPAFWGIHQWCQRYLGLDVQDAERMSWHAKEGLPGSSWLNVLGAPLLDALGLNPEVLAAQSWEHGVRTSRLREALFIAAGARPTLGDVNRLQHPLAYAEVARTLEPHFVKQPPALPGGFWDQEETVPWMRRFLEPENWRGESRSR